MLCTHDLIVLTKTKETIRYCESFEYGGKTLSTNVSSILTQVSVPAEDGSQQLATFTHTLIGSSTFVPTDASSELAHSYPLHALQAKHKQPKLHKQQRSIHSSNSSTKATNNQIRL
jgi:hypothetical protein